MAIKTENLAIIMTDIVGFTEATVHQSRIDIDVLLDTHNRILLPIVRRYRGRHIKSIGDALLLVFRSPTDAMLCAMALQDALYEYNRSRAKEKQIRIRVGASLGEVRVTRNDVFGEPVNLTSRVTGITPPDEIYLTEALFMAMNKAEVPSQEVGWKELKGIGQPVRVYNIPRFSQPRLVPEAMATEDLSDLVYPYGGAHLNDDSFSVATHLRQWRRGADSAIKATLTSLLMIGRQVFRGASVLLAHKRVRVALVVALLSPVVIWGARFAYLRTAEYLAAHKVEVAKSAAQATPARTTVIAQPVETAATPVTRPEPAARPVARSEPVAVIPPTRQFTSRQDVEQAYQNKEIALSEYRRTLKRMEYDKERELQQAERDYNAKKMSKDEYKSLVSDIEKRYKD